MPPDSRLPTPDSPRCAVLTPSGRGAIATISVRGSKAVELVSRRFYPANRQQLAALTTGRVVFGRFETSDTTSEELVVGLIAPDEIEIHCHGGKAAAEAICESLAADGCQRITADLWATENESDPLTAQALLALASARTERTAAILLDQYRGALRSELTAIDRALSQGNHDTAACTLNLLLARAQLGLHLTQPWKVVIAGRPNAGKSSLMNAILGYQRSIVWHEPGTTRDVLTATTAIDGWPIELIDTAGLRTTGDPLETEGVTRAEQQIAAAGLVILVVDATAEWAADSSCNKPNSLIVHNKVDLARPLQDGRPVGIETSALTGQGIETLCRAVAQAIVPDPPHSGAAVPFTGQQVAVLEAVANDLRCNGAASAARERLRKPPFELQ